MTMGPHQLCDLVFYSVLPLFDCVYVCGAIFGIIAAKVNHPLLYSFFCMSACCTLTCYIINVVWDVKTLVGPERDFTEIGKNGELMDDIKEDAISGAEINCTDPK